MNNKHRRNQSSILLCTRIVNMMMMMEGEEEGEGREKKNGNHGYFQVIDSLCPIPLHKRMILRRIYRVPFQWNHFVDTI